MGHFAIINNGIVENVIICDDKETAERVTKLTAVEFLNEPGTVQIGWTYDGTNFNPPVVETPTE